MCHFVMSPEVAVAARVDVLHRKREVRTYGVEDWERERGRGAVTARRIEKKKSAKLTELGMGVVFLSSGFFLVC